MAKRIFRQVALDRLASPEQVDQLIQVTTPKGWFALAAIGVTLLGAGAWSVGGTIPERVSGKGILLRSGGIFQVVAKSSGAVSDVSVEVGDRVVEGQVIARLAQPSLVQDVVRARARVAQLQAEHEALLRFRDRSSRLRAEYVAGQRASLEQSIAASQEILEALERRIESQATLVEQGLYTRQQLLRTQAEYAQEKEKVRLNEVQLAQLDVTELQAQSSADQQVEASRAQLADAEQELAQLEDRVRLATEITSPYSGEVLEVTTEQGALVYPGQPIVSISLRGQYATALEAVLFIPSVYGKRIRPGMDVHITPSTVEPEEYGYLVGRVTYVSDYPATAKAMLLLLKNEQLVSSLMGEDAPFEVHAELIPDPATASRYRWTSSRGPDIQLQSGTPATGGIIVENRRPIFKVLPQLYRIFGGLRDEARPARSG